MPVITIARQFGSGGRSLGVMLAEKMGYTLIDYAIIEELSKKARVTPDSVKAVERSAGGAIQDFWPACLVRGILTGSQARISDTWMKTSIWIPWLV